MRLEKKIVANYFKKMTMPGRTKNIFLCLLGAIFLLVPLATAAMGEAGVDARDNAGSAKKPEWLKIGKGLEFYEFRPEAEDLKITVLRIDPEEVDFVLKSAGAEGGEPRTLAQWAEDFNLEAAINASMYLPDNETSTGYMRMGKYINNPKIAGRFGAFFVAGPLKPGLPKARIVEKDEKNWAEIIEDYDLVIQNYRMTNSQRRILWSPGGPHYAISAIGQDGDGRILFMHSSKPVEAYNFLQNVLHLPLDARAIMYVEGGGQAGLMIQAPGLKRELGPPHAPSLLITGKLKASLPNVLGIKAKTPPNSTE